MPMRSRTFIPVLISLFALTVSTAVKADTPLEISMKHMSKAYKQLALDLQQPQDANKSDYLTLAGTLKTAAENARGLVPKKAAALPTDQQTTMVTAYQKSMDDLIKSIDALTQDLQGSQWDEARKIMASLKQQMMDGHKAFRTKE
jgi:soluble cytochrome b562